MCKRGKPPNNPAHNHWCTITLLQSALFEFFGFFDWSPKTSSKNSITSGSDIKGGFTFIFSGFAWVVLGWFWRGGRGRNCQFKKLFSSLFKLATAQFFFITFIISVFGLIFRFFKLNFLTNDLTRTTGRHFVFPFGLTFIILD